MGAKNMLRGAVCVLFIAAVVWSIDTEPTAVALDAQVQMLSTEETGINVAAATEVEKAMMPEAQKGAAAAVDEELATKLGASRKGKKKIKKHAKKHAKKAAKKVNKKAVKKVAKKKKGGKKKKLRKKLAK